MASLAAEQEDVMDALPSLNVSRLSLIQTLPGEDRSLRRVNNSRPVHDEGEIAPAPQCALVGREGWTNARRAEEDEDELHMARPTGEGNSELDQKIQDSDGRWGFLPQGPR